MQAQSDLKQRMITAIFFGLGVILLCLWQPSFNLLLLLITFFCLSEFLFLFGKSQHKLWVIGLGVLPLFINHLNSHLELFPEENLIIFTNIGFFLSSPILLFLFLSLFVKWDVKKTISRYFYLFAWGYITFPLLGFSLIAEHFFTQAYNLAYSLGIISLIWINDSFAYLIGRKLGKTPLFPSVSPKKTWEGAIGGAVLTTLTAILFAYLQHYPLFTWAGYAIIVAYLGNYGDLIESKLKRITGYKDSGNALPGHGGFLDRFDALIYALPFIYIFSYFLNK